MSRFRALIIAIVSTFAIGVTAPVAQAQMWLDPANPTRPKLGPEKALGVVIWSHGRSVDSEDSTAPTPPYMAALRDGGWDTLRFNRMRASDTLAASSFELAKIVHQLKLQGYKQVVLTGQSFGSFLSLMAADQSDEVGAVMVTAPAAYGSFQEYYESWRENATKLYPLFEQVRSARVMVFYFHGDDFDPGGRGLRTEAILTARHLPHVVIDQPPLLTTHWAASTPQFARLYGNCILGFLDASKVADGARCSGDVFWAGQLPVTAPPKALAQSGTGH